MIDSSGRRILRADGTIFDVLPVGISIGVTGTLLVALFSLVRPEASHGLGIAARIGFWSLHVGLGMMALWLASRWLARGKMLPGSTLMAVLLSGAAGIAIAAPGYLVLDLIYEPYVIDNEPETATQSGIAAFLIEALELAPWFMCAWLLINLPVLLPFAEPNIRLDDQIYHESSDPAAVAQPVDRNLNNGSVPAGDSTLDVLEPTDKSLAQVVPAESATSKNRFLSTLPGIVGTDVIAVASDLHYLNVWTVSGRTTVFGNLKDVIAELDQVGMQVHRSHWVAHKHVRRITGTSSNAACILSNELRVPVSRRRWKTVREYYGRGVIHGSGS